MGTAEVEMNGKRYRYDLYAKAVQEANKDPKLAEDIENLKQDCIDRWYKYFIFEERLKNKDV